MCVYKGVRSAAWVTDFLLLIAHQALTTLLKRENMKIFFALLPVLAVVPFAAADSIPYVFSLHASVLFIEISAAGRGLPHISASGPT